jgi:hypothetical protein
MGEETKVYKVLVGKPKGRGHSEDRDIDGIRMDLREIGWGECGLDSTGSGYGQVVSYCECGDEPLGSYTMEVVG